MKTTSQDGLERMITQGSELAAQVEVVIDQNRKTLSENLRESSIGREKIEKPKPRIDDQEKFCRNNENRSLMRFTIANMYVHVYLLIK